MNRGRRSEPGLDLFRGVLVLGMFAVHARRLQPSSTRAASLADRALELVMWAEPFIAGGFLFVVGTSLVLSREAFERRAGGSWSKKLWLRAGWLYALAALLFVPQYGVELPDLIASPGILSVIALAIVAVGLALATRRPLAWLAAIAAAGIAITAGLDAAELSISGINAGPGGTLPLVSFTAAGAMLWLVHRRYSERASLRLALGAVPALALAVALDAPFTTLRGSLYAEHTGLLALPDLFHEPARRTLVSFWNHSALGALGLLAPLGLSQLAFVSAPRAIAEARALAPLGLLGRHALAAYVAHLALLGGIELFGLGPESALGTWTLVALLALSTLILSIALDRRAQSPVGAPSLRPSHSLRSLRARAILARALSQCRRRRARQLRTPARRNDTRPR